MSEQMKHGGHEKAPKLENKEAQEHLKRVAEKLHDEAEKSTEKRKHSAEKHEARKAAEKEAVSGKEQQSAGNEKKHAHEPVHRNVKKQTYKTTMRRVEAKLPGYQRSFSRVINNDTVDKVSNVASKTVARPSGLLGGAVVAFVALLIVTYYASRYGWEVSGSEFIVFVALGWIVGLLAEAVLKLIRR